MTTLEHRLSALEAQATPTGPILVAWLEDDQGRASTEYRGQRFAQDDGEEQADFFRKVGAKIPGKPVIWVSLDDAAL